VSDALIRLLVGVALVGMSLAWLRREIRQLLIYPELSFVEAILDFFTGHTFSILATLVLLAIGIGLIFSFF